MTGNPWTQKALEKLVLHYVDETGQQDFRQPEIAAWAKNRGYTMPVPLTDVELLAEMLAGAAAKAKRRDAKTSMPYRALLAYPVQVLGEWKTRWFDSDGPTASPDKIMGSIQRRKEQALNILVSARSTYERWTRTHPRHRLESVDFGISGEEVQWRLLGRSSGEDDGRNTG